MDFGGFIGRFHPLLVHMPIGLLILAGLLEYFARKPKYQKLSGVVGFTLFLGALFAVFSCVSGWLLANRGAYIERSLFLHRWLGIAVAVFAVLCWLIKTERLKKAAGAFKYLMVLMVAGIFATGHFGGNMTHGEDYLMEYAPDFLKNVLGSKKEVKPEYDFQNPDSVGVYADLLAPLFEDRCWKCHRPENQLGDLDMTTKQAFLKGGLHGEILEPGLAHESMLFERITLPVSDRESMPPFGLPLSFNQLRLVEWWIDNGASFEKMLGDFEIAPDIENLLQLEYGISFKQKDLTDRIVVTKADSTAVQQLSDNGFKIKDIAEGSNLLEVTLNRKADLSGLSKIKNQITWLSLTDVSLSDDDLKVVAEFANLTRLRIQNNPITDVGLDHIKQLSLLQSLNLNGTAISDEALKIIEIFPALETLYIFETKVSESAVEALKSAKPDLEVIQAFQFKTIEN